MSIDPTSQRSKGAFAALNLQLDDLPMDVFEIGGAGFTVESLTGGHGMTEAGASCAGPGGILSDVCPCSCHQQQ
jgi:hypothetical protein